MNPHPWRRVVPWGGALLIGAIVALAVLDVVRGYRTAVDETGRELDTQARIIAEQTARSMQAVDVLLRHLGQEHRKGTLRALAPQALHDYLREQAVGLVQIDGLVLVDADGTPRATSMRYPVPAEAPNLSVYASFRRLRDGHDSGLVIDGAMVSPVDQLWVFPIARRLETPAGTFDGAVGARGRIDYFQRFYRDIHLEPGTKTTLMLRDGTMLARYPPADASLGKRFPLFDTMAAAIATGQRPPLRSVSPVDGVERFGALQWVPDYPLAVLVTRDVEAALAPWRTQALHSAARTLALALLASLLLAFAMRQLARLETADRLQREALAVQERTEQALRESEERYALAVAGANQGLWDWDLASGRLFVSARAQRLLGIEPVEPLRPRSEWLAAAPYHADDVDTVRRALSDHLHGRTPHFDVEYRMRHRAGDWHWYRQRAVAVRDEDGRPYRLAGSMEDITDRKQAEAERDRLERQLRQAQKLEAIGTLAGGIAHDFNNILAAILGYGEMAQKGAPEGSALRRHVDAALAAGLRAKSLVERILAFSRSGVADRVPVHVQSVVEEALDLIAASLPPGVRLVRGLHAGDAAVVGDPTQIHQVVMNLCANAAQATKPGGELAVRMDTVELAEPRVVTTSTLPAGSYVCLAVQDTGGGIAPAVLERIFDPFFTTKEVGVGTGLGLSLVHGIVADLGGGIDVDSRWGEGATFSVYLPWQQAVASAPPVEEPVAQGAGESVLVVDDEEPLVRLAEEMMAELGYEAVGFSSSVAALAAFRAEPQRFDVVVSDESMPEMTGSELALAIRAIRPDIPIVMMSGDVTPALAARAHDAGVRDVLAKPLMSRDIARCLAAVVHCI